MSALHLVALSKKSEHEGDLLVRCKSGERAAMDEFLHRYRARVLNLAFQLLHDENAAEDMVQEVFVRAFKNLHSFRGESQIFSWLYQITINECRKKTRRAKFHLNSDDWQDYKTTHFENESTHRIAVERVFDELSEPLRVVLILRALHGLEYGEIARVLKIPIGTVRSRLHAARREFQKLWDES